MVTQQTILFFDLDNTLMQNPFQGTIFPIITEKIASETSRSPQQILLEFAQENRQRQQANPNHPLTMDWDDIVKTICQKYNVTLPQSITAMVEQYANPPYTSLIDDAPTILQALKQPHRKLVVASKGLSKYQNPVMKGLGLYPLFDDFLMPDLTSYLKTEPNFYDKYRTQENTIFIQIGDHYYDDVICPKRIGFYSILRALIAELEGIAPFERPSQLAQYAKQIATYPDILPTTQPDAIIVHLSELPQVIQQIESQTAIDSL